AVDRLPAVGVRPELHVAAVGALRRAAGDRGVAVVHHDRVLHEQSEDELFAPVGAREKRRAVRRRHLRERLVGGREEGERAVGLERVVEPGRVDRRDERAQVLLLRGEVADGRQVRRGDRGHREGERKQAAGERAPSRYDGEAHGNLPVTEWRGTRPVAAPSYYFRRRKVPTRRLNF